MANGLFGPTPAQVRAAELAQIQGQFQSRNPLFNLVAPGIFNLGRGLGNRALGAFGVDTRSVAEKQAAAMQDAVQGVDFSDFDSVMELSERLGDMNPGASIRLAEFARERLNTTTDEVFFQNKDGRIIPQVISTDKLGNRQVRLSGSFETLDSQLRAIEERARAARDPSDKFLGNTEVDGNVFAVFQDSNSNKYYVEDGQVKPYQGTRLFRSNEELEQRSGVAKTFGSLAMSIMEDKKLPGSMFGLLDGLDKESKQRIARTVAAQGATLWANPEIKRLFKQNKQALSQYLTERELQFWESDLFGDDERRDGAVDLTVEAIRRDLAGEPPPQEERVPKNTGGGPAAAATGGIQDNSGTQIEGYTVKVR